MAKRNIVKSLKNNQIMNMVNASKNYEEIFIQHLKLS